MKPEDTSVADFVKNLRETLGALDEQATKAQKLNRDIHRLCQQATYVCEQVETELHKQELKTTRNKFLLER